MLMESHIRAGTPGHAFTARLTNRGGGLLTNHVDALRQAFSRARAARPFEIDAIVVLPDHLHTVWTLPSGDHAHEARWKLIINDFSVHARMRRGVEGGLTLAVAESRRVWRQPPGRGVIAETDHRSAVESCWRDPVRHGLVRRPAEWPHSSLHRDIQLGLVRPDWTGGASEDLAFDPA